MSTVWIVKLIRYYRDIDNYNCSEVVDGDEDGYFTTYESARKRLLDLNKDLPPVYPEYAEYYIYDIDTIERSEFDTDQEEN